MDPLEFLRSKNRYPQTLPSGMEVTLRLPRIRDCIIAGGVPLPVLDHVVKAATTNGDSPQVSVEDAAHMARFQDELVRRSIVEIEGEPVEMTADAVGELSQEDYDHVVMFATRQVAVPKAPA